MDKNDLLSRIDIDVTEYGGIKVMDMIRVRVLPRLHSGGRTRHRRRRHALGRFSLLGLSCLFSTT